MTSVLLPLTFGLTWSSYEEVSTLRSEVRYSFAGDSLSLKLKRSALMLGVSTVPAAINVITFLLGLKPLVGGAVEGRALKKSLICLCCLGDGFRL